MRLPPPTLARSAESLGATGPPLARTARDALRARWGGGGSSARLRSVRATSFPWHKFALRLDWPLGMRAEAQLVEVPPGGGTPVEVEVPPGGARVLPPSPPPPT